MSSFSLVCDLKARLGECPLWSAVESKLYLIDIKRRQLHCFDPEKSTVHSFSLPEDIGCIGLVKGGGFIAGLRSAIWLLDRQAQPIKKLVDNPEDHNISRFNDGMIDPKGRFILGTVDESRQSRASIYSYDPQHGLKRLVGGLLTANGISFSPDGRKFYYSDTPNHKIFICDYDPEIGTITNSRVFAALMPTAEDRGRPDGAAMDVEGCYWTALYEGGRVQRYNTEGRLLAEYPVPAQNPTMVSFGGRDLKTLYVTSARQGCSEESLQKMPFSGGVFAMPFAIKGVEKPLFNLHI